MKLKKSIKKALLSGVILGQVITSFTGIIVAEHSTKGKELPKKPEPIKVETKKEKSKEKLIEEPEIVYVTFNPYDLKDPSNATANEIESYLSGTYLEGLGYDFYIAEQETGINAIFLASLAANESGWGKSSIARNKNNLFGFSAYNVNPGSSASGFSSKSECIAYTSRYLAKHYLSYNGKYYNGESIWDVNNDYCLKDDGSTDYNWSSTIISIANKFKKSINYNK